VSRDSTYSEHMTLLARLTVAWLIRHTHKIGGHISDDYAYSSLSCCMLCVFSSR